MNLEQYEKMTTSVKSFINKAFDEFNAYRNKYGDEDFDENGCDIYEVIDGFEKIFDNF